MLADPPVINPDLKPRFLRNWKMSAKQDAAESMPRCEI